MEFIKKITPIVTIIIFVSLVIYINMNQSPILTDGDFRISSTVGTYDLKSDRGKIVLLYFGYRFCPDVCPTTLSSVTKVYSDLSTKQKKKIRVVFISVDIERDNLKNLKEYISFFNQDFIAAVDTKNNIDEITRKYGVKYSKYYPDDKEEGFYTVDHSADLFLIGKDGKVKTLISHGESVKIMKNKIIELL
ncbi:MAG: SCO family protein [Oligoflexia bacterium]|nr:SCO family protein [Oligoflexia bacterium]